MRIYNAKVYEGLWEEIVLHAAEFAGERLIVFYNDNEPPPIRSSEEQDTLPDSEQQNN